MSDEDDSSTTSSDMDRKYQPPPPSDLPHPQGRMTKDDLHQWSIYRQNLTSSIAESVLAPLVGGRSNGPLPYGNFQMHDQSIESVLHQGRQDDYLLGDKGDIYLKFGLPRVAVQRNDQQQQLHHQQQYRLYKPGGQFLQQSSAVARKTQSEMDIRRAVLDAPSGRGPYLGTSKFSGSLENGLDLLGTAVAAANTRATNSPMPQYAHSDVAGPTVSTVCLIIFLFAYEVSSKTTVIYLFLLRFLTLFAWIIVCNV